MALHQLAQFAAIPLKISRVALSSELPENHDFQCSSHTGATDVHFMFLPYNDFH